MDFEKDVDRYIEDGFMDDYKETEADQFMDDTEMSDDISKVLNENKEIDKDFEAWKKTQDEKEWSILYSKHPDWVIDEDDYDKILINLLESYQEFKFKLNDMSKIKEIEKDQIKNNEENKEKTKREPKKIRKFFSKIYDSMSGVVKIEDVKLDVDEFVRYVRIVSNSEIELVNGGDDSEM